MPVPSQKCDSWNPFVWCVWDFDFSNSLVTFGYEFSSELSFSYLIFNMKNVYVFVFINLFAKYSNEKEQS